MNEKLNEKWTAESKRELAEVFSTSLTTVTNWMIRGCPSLPAKGRRHRFHVPSVIQWLALGDPDDDAPELSVARARLAESQTRKTEVEVQIKQTQLNHILSGGVIPAGAVRDLMNYAEVLVLQAFDKMIIGAPQTYLHSTHLDGCIPVGGELLRLRSILAEWRPLARDEFRAASAHLLERYLGDQGQASDDNDGTPDDGA